MDKPKKHILSKSTFIRGYQCEKSLYLHKNRYFLRDKLSPAQLAKFKRGTDIGIIAQELFPGGKDSRPKSPSQYAKSVIQTQIWIDEGVSIIYEAAVKHKDVLIFLDILVKKKDKFYAYEVKSSLAISQTYIMDAALQYYVLRGAGLEIEDFYIIHVKPEYRLNGDFSKEDFFKIVNVTEKLLPLQSDIEAKIESLKAVIKEKHSPKIQIGSHCYSPYPCDFIGHCWKNVVHPSAMDLNVISMKDRLLAVDNNLFMLDKVESLESIPEIARKQAKAIIEEKDFYDRSKAEKILPKTDYSLYSVCFTRPAIPLIENARPYSLLPWLMSTKSKHIYWEENSEGDVCKALISEFLKEENKIMVFDKKDIILLLEEMQERNDIEKKQYLQLKEKIFCITDLITEEAYIPAMAKAELNEENLYQHFDGADKPPAKMNEEILAKKRIEELQTEGSDTTETLNNYSEYLILRTEYILEKISKL